MPSLFKTLFLLGNVVLVALAVRPLGIGREQMKYWGLTVVFVGVALTMMEDAVWSLLIRKEDGRQKVRTIRATAIGATFCLIVAISGGFYAIREERSDVDYQRKLTADHEQMRKNDKIAAEAAPILEKRREKRATTQSTTSPVSTDRISN